MTGRRLQEIVHLFFKDLRMSQREEVIQQNE